MSATGWLARAARSPWVGPLALLAALCVDAETSGGVRQPWGFMSAALMALPFAVRRARPYVPVLAVAAALFIDVLVGVSLENWSAPLLALYWAIFTGFSRLEGARRWLVLTVLFGALVFSVVFDGGELQRRLEPQDLFFLSAMLGPAIVTGVLARSRQRYLDAVEDRAAAVEREQDARLAAALAEDRLQIARDMHDVVAHTVSLMSMNVGAVRRRLAPEQEQLRDLLTGVEDAGRVAIDELHHMLRVLRASSQQQATAPRPGLDSLGTLVEAARASGQEVALHISGDPHPVPPGLAVCAYRVVQEALTNARRHAPGDSVDLAVDCRPSELDLAISNRLRDPIDAYGAGSGSGAGDRSGDGSGGHGLIGMRERVQSYGGTLHAGPDRQGCYLVRARLPYLAETGS